MLDRDVLTEKLKGVDEQLNLAAEIMSTSGTSVVPLNP